MSGPSSTRSHLSPRRYEIDLPAGQVGASDSGMSARVPVPPAEQLNLSYRIRFPHAFDFAARGVLPGLSGGQPGPQTSQFDHEGWSATLAWDREGRLRPILRANSQSWRQAEAESAALSVSFEPGRTHAVEIGIAPFTSDPGQRQLTIWLDGRRVFSEVVSTSGDLSPVDAIQLSAFVYGDGHNHGPRQDTGLQLSDITVSRSPILAE